MTIDAVVRSLYYVETGQSELYNCALAVPSTGACLGRPYAFLCIIEVL